MKSKKTLLKRIKITSSGKVLRKSVRMGHLKIKLSANRKMRKGSLSAIHNKQYVRNLMKLISKQKKGTENA